jgi:predicted Zn-dependent peptidase
MPKQEIAIYQLKNGLTVLIESMPYVQSVAFNFLVPGGSAYDSPKKFGTAALMTDLLTRGAGPYGNRELTTALDNLGVQGGESAGSQHISLGGAALGSKLFDALSIYKEILRAPHFDPEELPAAKAGSIQMLRSIEDEPRQKLMVELRKRCYSQPWSNPTDGQLGDIGNIEIDDLKAQYRRCFQPARTILSVAGAVDPQALIKHVENLFGDWENSDFAEPDTKSIALFDQHITQDTTQTHIGMAYPAVSYDHDRYFDAWAAIGILSGGMSSRLFTRVREERGLCYTISASLHSLHREGRVVCYAGTMHERAQETLDVTMRELRGLASDLSSEELIRCQARAKSSLIMQQESTTARASAMTRDWYYLSKIRTLDEIHEKVNAVTLDSVTDYCKSWPAHGLVLLTIGPTALDASSLN